MFVQTNVPVINNQGLPLPSMGFGGDPVNNVAPTPEGAAYQAHLRTAGAEAPLPLPSLFAEAPQSVAVMNLQTGLGVGACEDPLPLPSLF